MKKILIIGSPGSGKTTLGIRLAEKLGLPLVHLDRLFWRDGWKHVDRETFDELLLGELQKPEWIIEGEYSRTIPLRVRYCDTVIWLDYPRLLCLWGAVKRIVTNYGKTRPDMAANCPEWLDLDFLKYVWTYPQKKRPQSVQILAQLDSSVKVIRLQNRRQTKRFLEQFE